MLRQIGMLLTAFLLFVGTAWSAEPEHVVLQLKWENDYQFAGFYAAKWQGYYRDAGLDVEIRPAFDASGHLTETQQALVSGAADFAIGGADILVGRDQGLPLVVLAPIFQRTPAAIVTLEGRRVQSMRDLAGLRIAVSPGDYINYELISLIDSRMTRYPAPVLVNLPLTLDTLVKGKADALLTYGVSALEASREAGIPIHLYSITQSEDIFYGDTLYTHQRVIDRSPDMVRRFTDASLRGWQYALDHPQLMAEAIAKLPRNVMKLKDPLQYSEDFARRIRGLMFYPHYAVGANDPHRWERMHRLMTLAGVLNRPYDGDSLLFKPESNKVTSRQSWLIPLIVIGCGVLLLGVAIITLPAHVSVPMVGAGLAVLLSWSLEDYWTARYQEQVRKDVWSNLANIRVKMEAVINDNFSLLRGVAGVIASEPEISQEGFVQLAEKMMEAEPLLINIAAAPDMVIRYIYPKQSNEQAINLDYRNLPEQLPMVQLVKDARKMVVAGPMHLVQGGWAIIGRAPVYLDVPGEAEDKFWGIVSAPMDFEGLLDESGLTAANLPIEVAMRHGGVATGSQVREVFFGNPDVFSGDAVVMPLSLGLVEWEIAARPKGGWGQIPAWLQWFKLFGLLLALAASIVIYTIVKAMQSRIRISGELERNQSMLGRVSRIAEVGGWEVDLRNNREHISDEVFHLHGILPYSLSESDEKHWLDHYDEASRDQVEKGKANAIATGEIQQFEVCLHRGEYDEVWLRHLIEPVVENGDVVQLLGVVQDISTIRRADATIQHQASYDSVTGLPNRNLFNDRLKQAVYHADREHSKVGLLFIDLDHFKDINDSLGHKAGDMMLKEIGRRFSRVVRNGDTVARLGGDEFTVLLDGIRSSQHCATVAQKLLEVAHEPINIEGHHVFTSASIGVTIFPEDAGDVETLLQRADQAMYAAKNSGRNAIRFFTSEMQHEANRRHNMHVLLVKALRDQELQVYYQPIIDTRTKRIAKCEALLRWEHDYLGPISPAEFVPLAEDTGLIGELGEYVMVRACEDMDIVNRETGAGIELAFNKSTREFVEGGRRQCSLLDMLKDQPQFPNITVEITENLLMQDNRTIVTQLEQLRDAGIKIAIDDFGTGYSSLSYLRKFPVDIVKIDKSFIQGIEKDIGSRSLAEAIISMAHSLGIEVVAEGVETAGQLSFLQQQNCRFVQGFFYSPALPRDEFIRFVRGFRSDRPALTVV